jgi:hypothetical protein
MMKNNRGHSVTGGFWAAYLNYILGRKISRKQTRLDSASRLPAGRHVRNDNKKTFI